jgi:hypothetical protein
VPFAIVRVSAQATVPAHIEGSDHRADADIAVLGAVDTPVDDLDVIGGRDPRPAARSRAPGGTRTRKTRTSLAPLPSWPTVSL